MTMRSLSVLCTVASACFHAADSDNGIVNRRSSGSGKTKTNQSISTPPTPKKRAMADNNPKSSKVMGKKQRLSSCGNMKCISCAHSSLSPLSSRLSAARPATSEFHTSMSKLRHDKITVHNKTSSTTKSGAGGSSSNTTTISSSSASAAAVDDSPILTKSLIINLPPASGGDVVSVTDEEESVMTSQSIDVVGASSGSMEQQHGGVTKAISATASASASLTPTVTTATTKSSMARNYRNGGSSSSNIRSWHRPLPFPLRLPKPLEATGRNGGKITLGPITATL